MEPIKSDKDSKLIAMKVLQYTRHYNWKDYIKKENKLLVKYNVVMAVAEDLHITESQVRHHFVKRLKIARRELKVPMLHVNEPQDVL